MIASRAGGKTSMFKVGRWKTGPVGKKFLKNKVTKTLTRGSGGMVKVSSPIPSESRRHKKSRIRRSVASEILSLLSAISRIGSSGFNNIGFALAIGIDLGSQANGKRSSYNFSFGDKGT